jgi:hypothetical protein
MPAKSRPVRKQLSAKTRFEVFKRDGFVCQYCGGHPPTVKLHADHIIPVVEGGKNGMDNLITSCERCNLGKGPRSLEAIPQSLKDRAAETAEREAQIRGYAEVMAAHRERVENDCWQVAQIFMGRWNHSDISRANFQTIRVFVEKLGVHACIMAMELATSKMRYDNACFKYFCGICWKLIRESGE